MTKVCNIVGQTFGRIEEEKLAVRNESVEEVGSKQLTVSEKKRQKRDILI